MKKYVFGLCSGRHEVPVEKYIFGEIADPTDFESMSKIANDAIPADASEVEVFVTGLTPAMLAVASVCFRREIDLIAKHFDRNSGEYLPQRVLGLDRCLFCGARMHPTDWSCPSCGST